jgi:flagellar hook assembly protein FlgD
MASNAFIWTGPVYVTYDATSTVGVQVPQESARLSFVVGPIPSRGDVTASFDLPRAVPHAELSVFDLTGRLVQTLAHGPLDAGSHRFVWDGRTEGGSRAPAGIYLIHLDTSVGSVARRVLRLN